jgi:hypothetical protein
MIIGPSRTWSVAAAMAANIIHTSATCVTGGCQRKWSHTTTPARVRVAA